MVHRVEVEKESLPSCDQQITSAAAPNAPPIPPDALITLISSSLEEFPVKASVLFQGDLFRGLLDHELGFKEYWERRVFLDGVESRWVKRVIEYLEYKEQYNRARNTSSGNAVEDATGDDGLLPDFGIKEDEATELMKIADYLQL